MQNGDYERTLASSSSTTRRNILRASAALAAVRQRFDAARLTALLASRADADLDAHLIALCTRMVAAETELYAILAECRSVEAEEAAEPVTEALWAELDRLAQQVFAVRPVGLAGIVAKARAASAIVCRRNDGTLISHGGMAHTLAWSLVEQLAGGDHLAVESDWDPLA